ncbi:MAG TPA: hypothetical protein ENK18_14860 [Deltaproteobacteria bacterium]|nr:hypothetical protein [Deltaproteobacteria bacterium]
MKRTLWLLWAVGCAPRHTTATPQGPLTHYSYERIYAPETVRYRLETVQFQNGERVGRKVALSEHTSTTDDEQIRWIRLQEEVGGVLVDREDHALVAPYSMSLASGGSLTLPAHGVPRMDSLIKDLLTLWIAVGTAVGNPELETVGDTWTAPEPSVGDWSNPMVPTGLDCSQPTTKMIALQGGTARYQTTFDAPAQRCSALDPQPLGLAAYATEPVVYGHPNNFVQTSTDGRSFSVLWGMKSSVVSATVSTTDGRILGATMDLQLQLRLLECASEALDGCQGPFPMDLRRRITLQQQL